MYTLDDLMENRDAQITLACIVFFVLAFPAYFSIAADSADGSLSGGVVADYKVNGEVTYVLLDSGSESLADGDTWSMTYNTDAVSNAEDLNIVGVRILMSYGEAETSSAACTGGDGEDTITGTASHLDHNGSASGQNSGGSGAHEANVTWFNETMVGAVVSDLTLDEIRNEIDSMGAGLGDHTVSITVDAETGGEFPPVLCQRSDGGEQVDYTVELMVFEYTIAPYLDTNDI